MTKINARFVLGAVVFGICIPFFAITGTARGQANPNVIQQSHNDTSPALSTLASLPNVPVTTQGSHDQESVQQVFGSVPDPVVQTSATGGALIGVSSFTNILGIPFTGVTPPDPNASIGSTQIVETVNSSLAVFSKTGATILPPTQIGNIWSGFGGQCDISATGTNNYADPVVLYDKLASRWFVAVIALPIPSFPATWTICTAVSTSSDATGTYNRYAYQFSSLPDYDKYSVWADAYYASFNMGGVPGNGAQACAFNRTAMLAGSPATTMVCFQTGQGGIPEQESMLPSDLDGSNPPAAGEPNFYLDLASSSSLNLFRFHVDFATPSNSSFTGPVSITVAPFSGACTGNGGLDVCIPQAQTTQPLEALGDRLMHRLAYRNFGDHESLVASHSVAAGSSSGPRWYEIRNPNGTPVVFQQGTFAPDSNFRWMGSIGMDGTGNIALGYSISSATTFPAIGVTGRFSTDTLGVMQAESVILQGGGAATLAGGRWGDYTSMAIDPTDDATFLYINEFYFTSGETWQTFLQLFKFGASAPPITSLVLNDFIVGPGHQSIFLANPNSSPANVGVSVNGVGQSVTVPANGGAAVTPSASGPALISSNVSVSAAMAGGSGGSLIEVNAVPASFASTQLVINDFIAGPGHQSIFLTNSNPSAATVTVIVGSDSQVVTVPANGGAVETPAASGPAFITSSIPILAAMAGGSGGSLIEVNAVPASFASTQLVINDFIVGPGHQSIFLTNSNSTAATATVTVNGVGQPVTIPANGGAVVTPASSGPAFITSSIPILAAMAGGSGGSLIEVNAFPF
jgi:hypothetical protein